MVAPHPAMLRDTVGEECRNLLTLSFFCFLTPPSLCATSPIAHACAEEEVNAFLLNCLCFLRLVSILVQHLVMLWDTAGGRVWYPILLLLQPMFSTPPSFGHLPYILRYKTQGRRVRCISLSLLLRFYEPHPAMQRGTAGKKWNHTEFSFGFISDIKKEVSQINGILPRMIWNVAFICDKRLSFRDWSVR